MRQILLALILLSCAGDEARRPAEAVRAQGAADPPPRSAEPARPAPAAPLARVAAREPADDPRAQARRAAHDALAENCGECHEGHRSTNAKALAVFDLDQPDWPGRFTEPRFAAALRRLASRPEPVRAAFLAFRDAELAAVSGGTR